VSDDEVPRGWRREWVPDDSLDWEVGGNGRKCRMKRCNDPAVAALARRHHRKSGLTDFRWWYYCAAHLYGRKIEDGVVKVLRLVEVDSDNV